MQTKELEHSQTMHLVKQESETALAEADQREEALRADVDAFREQVAFCLAASKSVQFL